MTDQALASTAATITVRRVNYADPLDAQALVALLDAYARDRAGGGTPLPGHVCAQLAQALQARPQAFSVIAWARDEDGTEQPVGLVNCFEGFSTFACRPLVNIHDLAVLPAWRGRRVAQQMLALVERIARERGACKLTLEVLQGNQPALRAYTREGFAGYTLDPAMGQAQFLQKLLD
ncbi:GNAT family N-acetyltransferase [Pulveribacter sp.]|uniref:GNAT family N-acetyltransferase n=1 Tax=Pulveribacter sp. TaxID=2678893 RepID=UPI00289F04BD|nr:GNAT family N-acetyltransferase [Pulveribacter sp.]